MNKREAGLFTAILAGLAMPGIGFAPPEPLSPAERARKMRQRDYPMSGTGKRQGERVARQVARSLGDPFAASNKCIERIKAKLAAREV